MSKIQAIIIDLDGTLRDSREAIWPALQHALKVHTGKNYTREEIAPFVHFHGAVHKALAPDSAIEDFTGTYSEELATLWPNVTLYKDALAVLERLQAEGYRIGTVTMARDARHGVEELGISGYFTVAVGRNDVAEIKPHPRPILVAVEQFGLKPEEVVMLGDLPVDIQASHAAGLRAAVGITHGFGTREQLEEAGADYVIDSLAELPSIIAQVEHKVK